MDQEVLKEEEAYYSLIVIDNTWDGFKFRPMKISEGFKCT